MSRSFYGRTGVSVVNTVDEGIAKLMAVLPEAVSNAVLAGGEVIRQRAAENANVSPRIVGHAKDGRHMRDCVELALIERPNGADCRVFIDLANVPYAVHQEFGPNGNAFMRRAVDETRGEVHAAMRASLASAIAGGTVIQTAVRFRRIA